MADEDSNDAVLSDVEGDDDPVPIVLPSPSTSPASAADALAAASAAAEQRVRDLLADLEKEHVARKSAEATFGRLKTMAHDAIRQRDDAIRDRDEAVRRRDEAVRDKDEAARSTDRASTELAEALHARDEVSKQKDSLRSEMETAAQMLLTGIGKISSKVSGYKNFASGGLPTSQKYTGLPSVAYGVIKRSHEISEELMKQIDAASKGRDQAREQVEQRNYEIAIEVSQLEASIMALKEDISKKSSEIESLEKTVSERGAKISEMDDEISRLTQLSEDRDVKIKSLEAKLESQRPLIIEHLNYTSKIYEQICEIVRNIDKNVSDPSESSDSMFMWNEMDIDDNLRISLDGSKSVYELAKVAMEKVRVRLEESSNKINDLNEKVMELVGEKQHIGTLLRSALSSRTNEVRHVAEEGLREAGIDVRLDHINEHGSEDSGENEVYILAGALETTVKESHTKIIELQQLVEVLRAESSLLKARLDTQSKEITQLKHHIKELEEKERLANENVEGLMMDITGAEEEIARWKAAAEQEAAAGRAVEQEFQLQLSALRKELEEAKQATLESENKLKFKEETAAAAMAARDAAEKSLKLADMRSTRLRERLEELNRQLEESENQDDHRSRNSYRYVCWPWQWLGLNLVRFSPTDVQQNNNEMELSEPLV